GRLQPERLRLRAGARPARHPDARSRRARLELARRRFGILLPGALARRDARAAVGRLRAGGRLHGAPRPALQRPRPLRLRAPQELLRAPGRRALAGDGRCAPWPRGDGARASPPPGHRHPARWRSDRGGRPGPPPAAEAAGDLRRRRPRLPRPPPGVRRRRAGRRALLRHHAPERGRAPADRAGAGRAPARRGWTAPPDAARLLAPVAGGADYAIGSRFCDRAASSWRPSLFRRLGIRWFAAALRLAGARGVTDPTSGFFAANARAARFLAEHYASDYPEVDAVVRLARRGLRLLEVPVAMRERGGGVSSIGALGAVADGYEGVVTMDADWSHDPAYLPGLVAAAADHELVVGSRYLHGISVVNWTLTRLMLSQGGNLYVRTITGLPLRDCTSGFQV